MKERHWRSRCGADLRISQEVLEIPTCGRSIADDIAITIDGHIAQITIMSVFQPHMRAYVAQCSRIAV